MSDFFFLIPIALGLGLAGLGAFMWALKDRQYDDLDGAAARILIDEEAPVPDQPLDPVSDLDSDSGRGAA